MFPAPAVLLLPMLLFAIKVAFVGSLRCLDSFATPDFFAVVVFVAFAFAVGGIFFVFGIVVGGIFTGIVFGGIIIIGTAAEA